MPYVYVDSIFPSLSVFRHPLRKLSLSFSMSFNTLLIDSSVDVFFYDFNKLCFKGRPMLILDYLDDYCSKCFSHLSINVYPTYVH